MRLTGHSSRTREVPFPGRPAGRSPLVSGSRVAGRLNFGVRALNMPRSIFVDPLSASSLRVEPWFERQALATATGFTVKVGDHFYLITNWHVVTGRDADTGACLDKKNAATPDRLVVRFHQKDALGTWTSVDIPLFSAEGNPVWIEHPLGSKVDVVAIPLAPPAHVVIHPLDLSLAETDMVVAPAMPVSVIGFPLGLSAGENWPIWKTGHVASDPDIDFQPGRPAFLIDATTRSGMSGAPVVLRLNGGYSTSEGNHIMAGGMSTKFVGVYAGRIHDDSEIGRVWRPFVIKEVLGGKLLFNDVSGRTMPSRNEQCPCGRGRRVKHCCGAP